MNQIKGDVRGFVSFKSRFLTCLDRTCDFLYFREVINLRLALGLDDIGISSEFLTIDEIETGRTEREVQDSIKISLEQYLQAASSILLNAQECFSLVAKMVSIKLDQRSSKLPESYMLFLIMIVHRALAPNARVITLPLHFIVNLEILDDHLVPNSVKREEALERADFDKATLAYLASHFRTVRFIVTEKCSNDEKKESSKFLSGMNLIHKMGASIQRRIATHSSHTLYESVETLTLSEEPTNPPIPFKKNASEKWPRPASHQSSVLEELEVASLGPSGYALELLLSIGMRSLERLTCVGLLSSHLPFRGDLSVFSRLHTLIIENDTYKEYHSLVRLPITLKKLVLHNVWFASSNELLQGLPQPAIEELTFSLVNGLPYGNIMNVVRFVALFQDSLRSMSLKGIDLSYQILPAGEEYRIVAPLLFRLEMYRFIHKGSFVIQAPRLMSLELKECLKLRSLLVESECLTCLDLTTCVDLEHVDVTKCPKNIDIRRLKPQNLS